MHLSTLMPATGDVYPIGKCGGYFKMDACKTVTKLTAKCKSNTGCMTYNMLGGLTISGPSPLAFSLSRVLSVLLITHFLSVLLITRVLSVLLITRFLSVLLITRVLSVLLITHFLVVFLSRSLAILPASMSRCLLLVHCISVSRTQWQIGEHQFQQRGAKSEEMLSTLQQQSIAPHPYHHPNSSRPRPVGPR